MARSSVSDGRVLVRHEMCSHCVPADGFRSFVDGSPIIGGCRFSECGFLVRSEVECENFNEK